MSQIMSPPPSLDANESMYQFSKPEIQIDRVGIWSAQKGIKPFPRGAYFVPPR